MNSSYSLMLAGLEALWEVGKASYIQGEGYNVLTLWYLVLLI